MCAALLVVLCAVAPPSPPEPQPPRDDREPIVILRMAELLTSNCSYHRITTLGPGAISERLRRAFRTWGALPEMRHCRDATKFKAFSNGEQQEVVFRALNARSHTGETGNETADVLAKEGAQSTRATETARSKNYIDEVERRPTAQDQPQHRKTARRK